MVCIGKNIANCSNTAHFAPVIYALCALCKDTPNVQEDWNIYTCTEKPDI